MKNKNVNIGFHQDKEVNDFPKIDLPYTVSKDQVWENLSHRIQEPISDTRSASLTLFYKIAFAASVLIILGVAGFMKLYTKTVFAPSGQHLTLSLPDSSKIELNAQSTVTYHPFWFAFRRTITLDGEAFFKVVHANQFRVLSTRGETTVLGTSFNIYSRDDSYNVTCFTGKVKVVSSVRNEVVLLAPNEQAFINKDGFLQFVQKVNSQLVKSWRDNMFVFTGSSIVSVLKEIERQYNIKIVFKADPNLTYTGNFSRSLSEKEVLDLVCTSLGLKFDARSKTEFLVD
jgi:ferric-dicitrate binding protein FerR (iron transport regulator)